MRQWVELFLPVDFLVELDLMDEVDISFCDLLLDFHIGQRVLPILPPIEHPDIIRPIFEPLALSIT